MFHHNWVCVCPRARLQKGPYDIVKIGVGIKAVRKKNNEKEDKGQTKKGSEVPFPCSQGLWSTEVLMWPKMEAFAEFGVFRSFRLSITNLWI